MLHPDFIAINVWLCTFVTIVSQWITLKLECPQNGYRLFSTNNGNAKKKKKKKKKKSA